MTQVIVFRQDNGVAAVIYPAPDALAVLGITGIAEKDVPTGKPYAIIDAADLPADRSNREDWTVEEADLTDGVGV